MADHVEWIFYQYLNSTDWSQDYWKLWRMSEKTILSLSKFQKVTVGVDKITKLLQLSFRTCPDKENAIYVHSSVWNSWSVWIAKTGQDDFLIKQSKV